MSGIQYVDDDGDVTFYIGSRGTAWTSKNVRNINFILHFSIPGYSCEDIYNRTVTYWIIDYWFTVGMNFFVE